MPDHKPVVVMVTISNRVPYLNAFLETLVKHAPQFPIHIHMQDPDGRADEVIFPKGLQVADFMITPEPMGCHGARVLSQQKLAGQGFDTYINVDDDVALTPYTFWDPMVDYVHEPGVGFMLTNWARGVKQFDNYKQEGISHKVGERVLVYNGGGMLYNDDVAELMRGLTTGPARYDDMWPITSYINGYTNGAYYGSLTLHQTVSKGGMQSYMASEPRPLLGWKYVNYPRLQNSSVGSEYAIGMDSDLKPLAHELHRQARLEKGWLMNKTGSRGKLPAPAALPLDLAIPEALRPYLVKEAS